MFRIRWFLIKSNETFDNPQTNIKKIHSTLIMLNREYAQSVIDTN